MLEPITIGDPKHARSGDLRRILDFSVGNSLEDNSLGAAHLKNSSSGAVEELKQLRASVGNTWVKASGPTLKIGSLIHQNPTDLSGSKKIDDRSKNGGLNKRLRTSVAETRAECRNGVTQRQPLTATRERDLNKDNDADSDIVEGKIRRLPGAGEGWDKKMKRTRSVGVVFSRSIDNDREIKRMMHHKLPGESSLQSSDSTPSFRIKLGTRIFSRDLTSIPTMEQTLGKVNDRMGNREDNNAMCPNPMLKLKASRAPRSSSMVACSASNVPHVSVTLESWEQPHSVIKTTTIGGASDQKRSMPSGSSPPITQCVGQRPRKILRTRKTNLIPVSSHEDVQMQSEGSLASDLSSHLKGESEDDRKELIKAAKLACYSSVNACTSPFWKTVEFLFANIGAEVKSFLLEQLKLAEETCTSSYQNCGNENNVQMMLDGYGHGDNEATDSLCSGGYGLLKNSLDRMESVEQQTSVFGSSETENIYGTVTPLYQRLLSAFIIDDEIEESEEDGFGGPISSFNDPCLLIGAERTHVDLGEPTFGSQTPKTCNEQTIFSCNGNADPSAQDPVRNGVLLQRDGGSEQTGFDEKLKLELQSIGLFVEESSETRLDDDEIHMEIVQLKKRLHEQTEKKKSCLEEIYKAIQESENIGRSDLEKIAMDRLVELAYKKLLLANRGSFAHKKRISKASKKAAALAFAKTTLDRCRTFEVSGTSCFADPALRDVIFATPPRFKEAELLPFTTLSAASDPHAVMVGRRRPSIGKGKAKSKPKQKICASANGFVDKFTDTTNSGASNKRNDDEFENI